MSAYLPTSREPIGYVCFEEQLINTKLKDNFGNAVTIRKKVKTYIVSIITIARH